MPISQLSPELQQTAHVVIFLAACCLSGMVQANETADPRRPPSVETASVPVVSADLAERLLTYQNTRSADFRGWAPSGKGILIATRFGQSTQLHRVYEPAGRREQITFFEEPISGRFVPHDKSDQVLITISRGGDENFQVLLLDPSKFQTQLLTDGKSRNNLNKIRFDGKQLILTSNRRNGRDSDLYRVDLQSPGSMEMVMQVNREVWSAHDWSSDHNKLLLGRYVSANEGYLALFDLESRQRRDIKLPNGEIGALGPLAFSADGRSILMATDVLGEFRRLLRYDISTEKSSWLTDDIQWDVEELDVCRATGEVAFTINEDGASRLYLLNGDDRSELNIPLGIVGSLEFSPDGKQLGFTLARPDAPAEAYSISLFSKELTRWTFSETGGLNPKKFVTPSRFKFTTFDGRSIPAYYFRPSRASEKEKVPVLINIHGGPEGQYQPFFNGTFQYYVNELGLAVICPNVRGSNGYGKTYLRLDNATLREDSVKDIGALLDWIRTQPELDSTRVAVTGGSYGGYMVLASLTHFPDRIKAGIDVVGIANFITFLENTAPYRQDLRRAEYGDERDPKIREFFARINPTTNADRIRSALLVVHGKNDPRVPFSEARQIAAKIRSLGRNVWTVFADNEGHGFSKKPNVDYVRSVEATFLKENLGLKN